MNEIDCEDCKKLTGGCCWKHQKGDIKFMEETNLKKDLEIIKHKVRMGFQAGHYGVIATNYTLEDLKRNVIAELENIEVKYGKRGE